MGVCGAAGMSASVEAAVVSVVASVVVVIVEVGAFVAASLGASLGGEDFAISASILANSSVSAWTFSAFFADASRSSFSAVSYTHLTLPTTPYV